MVEINRKTCEGGESVGKEGWTLWDAAALGLLFVEVPCEWTRNGRNLRAEVETGWLVLRVT